MVLPQQHTPSPQPCTIWSQLGRLTGEWMPWKSSVWPWQEYCQTLQYRRPKLSYCHPTTSNITITINYDGENLCNANVKWSVKVWYEDLPAICLLVHQQRVTIERQDLDRYCLESKNRNQFEKKGQKAHLSPLQPALPACSPAPHPTSSPAQPEQKVKLENTKNGHWKTRLQDTLLDWNVFSLENQICIIIDRNKPVLKSLHLFGPLCHTDST